MTRSLVTGTSTLPNFAPRPSAGRTIAASVFHSSRLGHKAVPRPSQWIVMCALIAASWMGWAATAFGQAGTPAAQPGSAPMQAGPQSSAPIANQSMLYPGEDFQLAPGDLISVRVFGQPDYQVTVRVGLDGAVQLPYIGSVPLQGLTVRTAQALIAERLRSGEFYRDPDVIIQVLDTVNGTATVTGEMHSTIPVATERSLKDVLLTAGGLPANASHTVKIVRRKPDGTDNVIAVDLGTDLASSTTADIPVYPHDIIQITRASVVYVLGAFKTQGPVALDQSSPLTLLQLVALSGGIGFEGQYDDLRIVRTFGKERTVVSVDIKKVRDGKAPDPVLQANDIVFLPTSSMKAILKSLGVGGVFGVVSVLIAAHAY